MRAKSFYVFLFFILFSSYKTEEGFVLTVEVKGFPTNSGNAYVALFREGDDFPAMNKQYKGSIVKIMDQNAKVNFSNLESGKYALAVFHDVNKNGKLDKNILGIPTEAYGFSNNVREMFSAPSFNSASFYLSKSTTTKVQLK